MNCPKCNEEMGKKNGRYQYRESGLDNIWLEDWPMFVCHRCDVKMPLLPDATEAAQWITNGLVREKGRLDGDSIVFLRKAMGLKASELAQILGVDRVTVSRWENDKAEVDAYLDFKLRMEAVDRILPATIRRGVRTAIGMVLQHTYAHEVPMRDLTINVPSEESLCAV
ncbi:MAG TPA: type II TA system antitoxin MqsA family protein [Candidatus Angelobacter sp.]